MQDSSQGEQFVLFKIAEETYAVPISHTQEVLRFKEPKRIPHAPSHVLGVINLRGQIIPVIGLRQKFSLPDAAHTDETRIIVTAYEGRLAGVVCDSVERVVFLQQKNIEENPDFTGKRAATAIRGVAHLDEAESVIFLLSLSEISQGAGEISA